jgi:uncharacterized membrane-anchored protein
MTWLDDIKKCILAAGAALSVIIAGAVALNANAVATGKEITVQAHGFDPRDFLAGHYVRLAYDFSTPTIAAPDCYNKKGATIWVALAPTPGTTNDLQASKVACSRADLHSDALALKGKSSGYSRIEFGIERFYATQKDAERIEKALRGFNPDASAEAQPPVYAVLSVGKDGQARLKALLLGGERINLSWL